MCSCLFASFGCQPWCQPAFLGLAGNLGLAAILAGRMLFLLVLVLLRCLPSFVACRMGPECPAQTLEPLPDLPPMKKLIFAKA